MLLPPEGVEGSRLVPGEKSWGVLVDVLVVGVLGARLVEALVHD